MVSTVRRFRADGETVLDAVGHDNGDLNPETPGDWRP